MNLINSPILCTTASFHSFTPKPKAIIRNTHNNSHIITMLKKRVNLVESNKLTTTTTEFDDSLEPTTSSTTKPCLCGRRHFIEAAATATFTATTQSATATNSDSDYTVILFLYNSKYILKNLSFCNTDIFEKRCICVYACRSHTDTCDYV